jgi:hypothetical protein
MCGGIVSALNMGVTDEAEIVVPAGAVQQLIVRLQADEFNMESRSVAVKFYLQANEANYLNTVEEARFVGPGKT